MKLYNITNVNKFTEVVNSCKGEIKLINQTGVHDLKKELENLNKMNEYFGPSKIDEIEIQTTTPEDTMKLIHYLICA